MFKPDQEILPPLSRIAHSPIPSVGPSNLVSHSAQAGDKRNTIESAPRSGDAGPTHFLIPPGEQTDQTFGFHRISALKGLDFSEIHSRAELIRTLTQNIPLNDYGLPAFIYRCDLLDPNIFRTAEDTKDNATLLEDLLNSARVQVLYDQGFPSIDDGKPVWMQLAYEPKPAYDAFLEYLELPGVRLLSNILVSDAVLSAEWMPTYFWLFRARSYDLYRSTHHMRIREKRIMDTEDNHFLKSQELFEKVCAVLMGAEKLDELQKMDPDKLIYALEKLSKMQRVSLGLPAMGASAVQRVTQFPDVEVTLRQLTEKMRPEPKVIEASEEDIADGKQDSVLLDIHSNPDLLQVAQELILKIGYKPPDESNK